MHTSKYLLLFTFLGVLSLGHSQNWYTKSYRIELTDLRSLEDLDDFSFHAVEGSRTHNYSLVVDSSTLSIQFSFATMGGDDPTFIVEKNGKKMVVLYGAYYPDVNRNTSQLITKGKFREGYFTSFDGFFWEVEQKDKDWWLITHQNYTPIVLSFKEG